MMTDDKLKYRSDCRKFSGYRPCSPEHAGCGDCEEYASRGVRILLINLDSMGDVLRSTALLPALKRRYPDSHITWITLPRAAALLSENPLIDRVLPVDAALPVILNVLEFEIACNVDKGLPSGAIIGSARAEEKIGFGVDANGVIFPLNDEAEEFFRLGLDDNHKFFVNRKTENQLLAEAFGLEYATDEYVFCFSPAEQKLLEETKSRVGLNEREVVVGFNTGCSNLYPNKKLPLDYQKKLIASLKESRPEWAVVLLGGLEDRERNEAISREMGSLVINTPTDEGLRRGMVYTGLADVVFTGDSLGMHMAIALKKRIVAWFGLTCDQEIELYGRGEKLIADIECRPCWKKECGLEIKCYDRVDRKMALEAIIRQGESVAAGAAGL